MASEIELVEKRTPVRRKPGKWRISSIIDGVALRVKLTTAALVLQRSDPEVMGYSIRTPEYRYTEWRDFESGRILERELYDHTTDPLETVNCVNEPSMRSEVSRLAELLERQL